MTNNPFPNLPSYQLPSADPNIMSGDLNLKYWIILTIQEYENKDLYDFLDKIMQAIGVNNGTDSMVAILNQTELLSLATMLENTESPKTVISFGLTSHQLGLSVPYMPQELFYLRDHRFLFCDNLKSLKTDANRKRALWDSLQLLK
ncbi:MAG: hypothetical protein KDC53_15755 [Saprospiraceae bacterium]|nr:hypothetical protein [Saprospiraceae bacterium]